MSPFEAVRKIDNGRLLRNVPARVIELLEGAPITLRLSAIGTGGETIVTYYQDGRVGIRVKTPPVAWILVHELGHALDVVLGMSLAPDFKEARRFVSPRARAGGKEWFAEGFRAWCGENGGPGYPWKPVSRADLRRCAPSLFALFTEERFF